MPSQYTIAAILLSFFLTVLILPYWIKRARQHNLVGIDVHKLDQRPVAELGGLVVIFSAVIGMLIYVAIHVFVYKSQKDVFFLLAGASSLLVALVIGLVDDILGWKIGLRQYQKAIGSLLIALPIMAVNAGHRTISFPFIGSVDLGILYPLLFVPGGIAGASNAFNMIAGFNGLEAGMGIIIIGTLGFLAFMNNTGLAAFIAAVLFACLIAFFMHNKYPAIIFPGDTLTYPIGAGIAIIAIYGNIEKFAVILFIPYYIEFFLKLRGMFQKESFANNVAGKGLVNRYKHWYSLTHISVDFWRWSTGKVGEKKVVISILLFELIIAVSTVYYYFNQF